MSIERRKATRIDARINVQFKSGAEFISAFTQNISRGGIYLETETLPDPNARLELAFDLSRFGGNSEVVVQGRVVRTMSVSIDKKLIHKVGVQFVDVEPETQAALNSLFANLTSGRT